MDDNLPSSLDPDSAQDPKSGFYPIHQAAKSGAGSTKELRRLIEKGVEIDVQTPWGRTALLTSCLGGEPKKAEMLVEAGANINVADKDGNTPLHAAICGSNRLVSYLIESGADVEIKNGEEMTPLRYACYVGKQGAIEALCAAGANVKVDKFSSESLIFHVLDEKRGAATTLGKIIKTLIKFGASTNFPHPTTGDTELHLAARLTDFDYIAWGGRFVGVLKQLINSGVDPWGRNYEGISSIETMHPDAHQELKQPFKKFLKGREKDVLLRLETVSELKCFYFNQNKYSRDDIYESLRDGTPAKSEFESALELPLIDG